MINILFFALSLVMFLMYIKNNNRVKMQQEYIYSDPEVNAISTGSLKELQAQADLDHYRPIYNNLWKDVKLLQQEKKSDVYTVYTDRHKKQLCREIEKKTEKLYQIDKKIRKAQYILNRGNE